MLNSTFRNNYELGRKEELRAMITFEGTIHSLPHRLCVFMDNKNICCDMDIEFSLLTISATTERICCSLRKMGGRRKRVDPASCKEWNKKTKIWDILE